jgi:DNA polymerase-4
MAVLGDFTPLVQRISIDEAFLDVSGSVHLFGPAEVMGEQIRTRVRTEIGLPISVGAACTKHLAKIASQVAKPDGLVVVHPAHERSFLDPLPVGLIWGVGPVTRQRLADRGIHTIGQLAAADGLAFEGLLGRALGGKVSALAADADHRRVQPQARAGSVGAQSGFGRRDVSPQLIRSVLGHLADRVAGRLRAKHRAGRTITVRVRFASMRRHPIAHRAEPDLGHADPDRDCREAGVQSTLRSRGSIPDLAAGDLGVEPHRSAGPAAGVAGASR